MVCDIITVVCGIYVNQVHIPCLGGLIMLLQPTIRCAEIPYEFSCWNVGCYKCIALELYSV